MITQGLHHFVLQGFQHVYPLWCWIDVTT